MHAFLRICHPGTNLISIQIHKQEADSNLQFDEMILEAARGIMAASSALVRAANAAQRELIEQGKVARSPHSSSDDGQWSEGLISAARLVAAATHSLVEAAQNLVQGVGTEEMLISSAKQVAASTAQLLIACKVRSDPNSETGRRLQAAGNAVIKSTDNLVRAAQQAIDMEEEHILKINTSMVDGMAQEINARSEVIKMEKQLEEARNKLVAIRQAKYRHRTAAGLEDSGDEDYMPPPPPPPPNHTQYSGHSGLHSFGTPNRSFNTTPQSPSFHNASSSTLYNQPPAVPPPPSGHGHGPHHPINSPLRGNVLTANSVPRPYQPHAESGSSPLVTPHSPLLNRSFNTSNSSTGGHGSVYAIRPGAGNVGGVGKNAQLEACVQDLHEKTFGKSGVVPLSTFKTQTHSSSSGQPIYGQTQNGQNYEGFTTR